MNAVVTVRLGAFAGAPSSSGCRGPPRWPAPPRHPLASLSARRRPLAPLDTHGWAPQRLPSPEFPLRPFSLMSSDSMSSGDEDPSDDDDSDKAQESGSPRRTVLMGFTCNQCGGRTERRVNPLALAKGLVIVQCGECEVWHKVADSQGLIVEYNLRDEE